MERENRWFQLIFPKQFFMHHPNEHCVEHDTHETNGQSKIRKRGSGRLWVTTTEHTPLALKGRFEANSPTTRTGNLGSTNARNARTRLEWPTAPRQLIIWIEDWLWRATEATQKTGVKDNSLPQGNTDSLWMWPNHRVGYSRIPISLITRSLRERSPPLTKTTQLSYPHLG